VKLGERLVNTAVLAGRLALCPGDDILTAGLGALQGTNTSENRDPAALLYESPVLKRIRRTDRRGNELLESVPNEVVLVEINSFEREAVEAEPFDLEPARVA
jgi:hypothetical protein